MEFDAWNLGILPSGVRPALLVMNPARQRISVALLTPYTGWNLGDGAIQDAVIDNLRARLADPEVVLISISPLQTGQLHGVPGFPIAGAPLPYYSSTDGAMSRTGAKDNDEPPRLRERVERILRGFPGVTAAMKRVKRLVRAGFRYLLLLPREAIHLYRSTRLLRQVDLLIISGGGQIDDYWGGPWAHPYALFKWSLLARATGTRLVFLSVGVCTLDSRLSGYFVRRALRWADYRSYRDQHSRDLLRDWPFTRRDAICPDLAFSHPGAASEGSDPPGRSRSPEIVALSPIAYLSTHGWPRRDAHVFAGYIKVLASFTADLLRDGWEVVLFASDFLDQPVLDEMGVTLGGELPEPLLQRLRLPRIRAAGELINALLNVDVVIASRLHGVILAHLAGKPVLAISYDRKVNTYMEDMDQAEYCLAVQQVQLDVVAGKFKSLIADAPRVRTTVSRRVEECRKRLAEQYDYLVRETRPAAVARGQQGNRFPDRPGVSAGRIQ